MTYARDPYDTDQPPCFCDQEAGAVLTTQEFCPAHGDPGKPCADEPDDRPELYPCQIAVFCDTCGAEVAHDYAVHDLMTRDERLAVARAHLTSDEGWSCTDDGDHCPDCKPSTTGETP